MASKGVVVFRGDLGNPESHYAKCQIVGVTNAAALATLVTAMAFHTDCNIAKSSFIDIAAGTDSAPGADANVDRKMTAYFRDPTDLSVHSVTIPSPPAANVENTSQGERYKALQVNNLVAAINTATGKSYTALYGVVTQKR
jgi:hypothetical protein